MSPAPIDTYHAFLQSTLSPARYQHSVGVMQTMLELAPVYALDPATAQVAGLLHDAAKDLSEPQQRDWLARIGLEPIEPLADWYNISLHGPVGAQYIQEMLGVTDPAIINAIYTHTADGDVTDPAYHAPLAWCLRFADVLEPNRDWSKIPQFHRGLPRLRQTVLAGRIWEAALLQSAWVIAMFEERAIPLHPNWRRIKADLMAKLGVGEEFVAV